MKRALIFDFGGVLMKTHDYRPRHLWDERLGLSHGSVERVVHGIDKWLGAQRGEVSLAAYWSAVADQLRLTPDDVQQLAHDFYSGDQLDMHLIDYIRQRRIEGYSVALLSNDSPALLDKLTLLEIAPLFDPLIISAHIGTMKPNAAAYRAVLDALQRPADETIFIDDSTDNIAGAAALGIHTLHYHPNVHLPDALQPLLNTGAD